MKNTNWTKLKEVSEIKFKRIEISTTCYGYQIQEGTKWNEGLNTDDIKQLEKQFGFQFPTDYNDFLKVMNGFATKNISIDPEGVEDNEYQRRCYKYPDDFDKVNWLIEEVNLYIKYAKEALIEQGFNDFQIEGFVPLYGHRALVVLKDKSLSPVLSIWGNDIIVYGENLMEYWIHELYLESEAF